METEIKLSLPEAARPAVEAHPLFAAVEARRSRDVSTYYDTPDLALRQRGVSVRVRQSGDSFVQTVKRRGGPGGFASRGEWEQAVASDALDRGALARDADALALLADDLDRLAPVVVTEVERTLRVLTLDGKTTVEAALDTGEVRAGDKRHPLSELELELKGGPVGPMLRLAADLAQQGGLRIEADSKAERGYALLTEGPPPQENTAGLAMPEGVTLAAALPLMLAAAGRDFAADLSGAARGDIEGVHRLRAAIRKMRTLLVLFAPHLDPAATARFEEPLRDFGRTLGAGRDWDVFLTETLADAEADLGPDALAPLRQEAERRRAAAHDAVAAAIAGPLPTDMLLGLALWTADAGWLRDGEDAGRPFAGLLPGLLDRLERRALKRGRHLASLDTAGLHDLRKSLKKLRYASEDVSALFRPKPVDRYVARIKKVLQDLGRINDAAVTAERIAELAPPGDATLAPSAAALLAWNAKRRKGSERDLRRRWRKFRHADPFWS